MVVEVPATHADLGADSASDQASSSQPWPKASTGWFAVCVFAIILCFFQLEAGVIQLLIQPIEQDFHINDSTVSLLQGLAPTLVYAIIAVPASRYVDIWPRNILMAGGVAVASIMTTLCGLAQNFWQLFGCRLGQGLGGVVNGPATWSMIADYFPREKMPRAIGIMGIGGIAGGGIALVAGGAVTQLVMRLPNYTVPGIGIIHHWQLVFLAVSIPGFFIAALMRSVPEPARRGRAHKELTKPVPLKSVINYLWQHRAVYGPQFLALGFSVIEFGGTNAWRPTFFIRTYHWTAAETGYFLGLGALIGGPIGLGLGTWLTEHFTSRGDNAANLRVVSITYSLMPLATAAAPLMPNPWFALVFTSIATALAYGGSVGQNAALQSITPNEMRGQVSALYLFVFTVLGTGLGPTFIALITNYVIGDQNLIRYALAGSAALVTPIGATIMWRAVKPYGEAIRQLKEREAKGLV